MKPIVPKNIIKKRTIKEYSTFENNLKFRSILFITLF